MVVCKTCQGNIFDDYCVICNPNKKGFCPVCKNKISESYVLGPNYRFEDGTAVPREIEYFNCRACSGYGTRKNSLLYKGEYYFYDGQRNRWIRYQP
jgi:hypothetical protein